MPNNGKTSFRGCSRGRINPSPKRSLWLKWLCQWVESEYFAAIDLLRRIIWQACTVLVLEGLCIQQKYFKNYFFKYVPEGT